MLMPSGQGTACSPRGARALGPESSPRSSVLLEQSHLVRRRALRHDDSAALGALARVLARAPPVPAEYRVDEQSRDGAEELTVEAEATAKLERMRQYPLPERPACSVFRCIPSTVFVEGRIERTARSGDRSMTPQGYLLRSSFRFRTSVRRVSKTNRGGARGASDGGGRLSHLPARRQDVLAGAIAARSPRKTRDGAATLIRRRPKCICCCRVELPPRRPASFTATAAVARTVRWIRRCHTPARPLRSCRMRSR